MRSAARTRAYAALCTRVHLQFGPPAPWAAAMPMPQRELDRLRDEFWGTTGTGAFGGQPGAQRAIWRLLGTASVGC